jgi:hypothetical protein
LARAGHPEFPCPGFGNHGKTRRENKKEWLINKIH